MQDVNFVGTTPLSLLNHSFGEDLIFITKFCLKMPRNIFSGTGTLEELGCRDSMKSLALAAPVVSMVLITVQKSRREVLHPLALKITTAETLAAAAAGGTRPQPR